MQTEVTIQYKTMIQYRSEINSLCTSKTHAQFLSKRVLKNAGLSTRLRAFPFVIHSHQWYFSPSLNKRQDKRQDKRQFLQTPLKIFPPTKQTANMFLAMRMVLTNVRLLLKYFCYRLNVNENNTSHWFSVILTRAAAVWISFLLPG